MRPILSLSAILLLPFLILISACKKSEDAKPIPLAKKMTGMRNWHRSHYFYAQGLHYPTAVEENYNLPDTSFALTFIGDSTIEFRGQLYEHDRTDATKKIHYFGGAFTFYEYGQGSGIAYFYANDSIVYCYGLNHGTSDRIVQKDLWYTF